MRAGYYMVAMVMHDQNHAIDDCIEQYQRRLNQGRLQDITFHMADLLHGQGEYRGMNVHTRKRMLVAFNSFVRLLPVTYQIFSYTSFDVKNTEQLIVRFETDLERFLRDNMAALQAFDEVAVYYDGGHRAVSAALRQAFISALSKNVTQFKVSRHQDKRLAQVADFFCAIELAAARYVVGETSLTYGKFFGDWRSFRANYLKQSRRKRFKG